MLHTAVMADCGWLARPCNFYLTAEPAVTLSPAAVLLCRSGWVFSPCKL